MDRDILILSVLPEMVPWVAKKQSAADAWNAIKTMWVGSDKVQKGWVQQLWREFEAITVVVLPPYPPRDTPEVVSL
jgi:hypothetical protein